jgi:polysaccharide biosynthesis/export protein
MRTNPFVVAPHIFRALPAIAFLLMILPANAQGKPAGDSRPLMAENDRQGFARQFETVSAEKLVGVSSIRDEASRIGPDDLLDISVFEAPEMNRTLRVSANGEISFELLGAVKASGLTPQELEAVLQDQLRRTFMKDPHVGVFVHELESHSVSVVGAVKKSGVFQIRGTKTVIEMLSMAEGLADDAGDTVLIMRGAGLPATEIPGAYASSQEMEGVVYLTSSKAARSGNVGPLEQTRKGKIEQLNLKNLLESKDAALNIPVYPGDIVKVTTAGVVYVVGEVHKPGGFILKNNQNISLLQALALAEGLTHTSATSQARIVRTDPKTGKRVEIPANLGKILSNKKMDPELQPEDILFIPNSAAKSAFYRAAEAAISTATGVAIYKW